MAAIRPPAMPNWSVSGSIGNRRTIMKRGFQLFVILLAFVALVSMSPFARKIADGNLELYERAHDAGMAALDEANRAAYQAAFDAIAPPPPDGEDIRLWNAMRHLENRQELYDARIEKTRPEVVEEER